MKASLFARSAILTASLMALAAGTAEAHHPMGGQVPSTIWQGLLSGVGHPVIGADHLAFILAVGLLAAIARQPIFVPAAFILGTLGGCIVHLFGMGLPQAELIIAASVAIAALLVGLRWRTPPTLLLTFVAAAGLAHGYAYGESIIGAENTTLAAYLVGFSAIQFAIAAGAAYAAGMIATRSPAWLPVLYRGTAAAMIATLTVVTALPLIA